MITIDVPECQEVVDIMRKLKGLVDNIWSVVQEREITYDDLAALLSGYEAYDSIYQCISSVFAKTKGFIMKTKLRELQRHYDERVEEIEGLLVRKPDNMPDLAR